MHSSTINYIQVQSSTIAIYNSERSVVRSIHNFSLIYQCSKYSFIKIAVLTVGISRFDLLQLTNILFIDNYYS